MNHATKLEKLLTRQEAAELLGLKPQTLAVWSLTGKNLPVLRISRSAVRYRVCDVQAFIESRMIPASTDA